MLRNIKEPMITYTITMTLLLMSTISAEGLESTNPHKKVHPTSAAKRVKAARLDKRPSVIAYKSFLDEAKPNRVTFESVPDCTASAKVVVFFI